MIGGTSRLKYLIKKTSLEVILFELLHSNLSICKINNRMTSHLLAIITKLIKV